MRRRTRFISAAAGVATAICALSLAAATAAPPRRPPGARAASLPTLGLASAVPDGAGFGRVRPHEVSYGGDPTSLVWHVRWRTWGGAQAVGRGTAEWVWPGWCVACGSVDLPARVVAFDLTTCGGQRAYSYVEWYFPSRGMVFDRRLTLINLCHAGSSTPPPVRIVSCGHVMLPAHGPAAARAGDIQLYDSPIGCRAARRFVARSGAARYLGRDARFTVRGWWCGSELSMDVGGPQSFSCARGDFTDLTFALRPA